MNEMPSGPPWSKIKARMTPMAASDFEGVCLSKRVAVGATGFRLNGVKNSPLSAVIVLDKSHLRLRTEPSFRPVWLKSPLRLSVYE